MKASAFPTAGLYLASVISLGVYVQPANAQSQPCVKTGTPQIVTSNLVERARTSVANGILFSCQDPRPGDPTKTSAACFGRALDPFGNPIGIAAIAVVVLNASGFPIIATGSAQTFDQGVTDTHDARAEVEVTVRASGGPVRFKVIKTPRSAADGVVSTSPPETNTFTLNEGQERTIASGLSAFSRGSISTPRADSSVSGEFLRIEAEPLTTTPSSIFSWENASGGDYFHPGNWNPNCDFPQHAGQRSDSAVFGVSSPATVPIFGTGATARQWVFNGAPISFSGTATLASTSDVDPSLILAAGGSLKLASGTLTTEHSRVGHGVGQSRLELGPHTTWNNLGEIYVGNPNSRGVIELGEMATLNVTKDMTLGPGGEGELLINQGGLAQIGGALLIGTTLTGSGSRGSVIVSGEGPSRPSTLRVTDSTSVGGPTGLLTVKDGAKALLLDDLRVNHMIADPNSAAVTVAGFDSLIDVQGRLSLGLVHPGDLIVKDSATIECTELVLGYFFAGGELRITGPASSLSVDQDAQVGGEGGHGKVELELSSFLKVTGKLTVGHVAGADLSILDSSVEVGNDLNVGGFHGGGTGSVTVSGDSLGTHLEVIGSVNVGISLISSGFFTAQNNANVEIGGDFHVEHFVTDPSAAAVTMQGQSTMNVVSNIVLGVSSSGDMIIKEQSVVECFELSVGSSASGSSSILLLESSSRMTVEKAHVGGSGGTGFMRIDAGCDLHVKGVMSVGSQPGGHVTVNGEISGGGIVIAIPGGIIDGTGTISAQKLRSGGFIAPGLSPGTLTIDGDFEQLPGGTLVIEIASLAPGQFDVLDVRSNATLNGTVEVRFLNGFLPRQGDSVEFMGVGGTVNNNLAQVHFPHIAPGFEAQLAFTPQGKLRLTALTDAALEPAPQFSSISLSAGQLTLAWPTVSGRQYRIEAKDDLNQSDWRPVSGVLTANGDSLSMDFNTAESPQRFFRIVPVVTVIPGTR